MNYPLPQKDAIDAEVARLKPRYEAFMQANGATPSDEELRAWATENLQEQIILETDAAKNKVSVNELLKQIAATTPRVTVAEARAVYKAHPEQFKLPERVHARHIVIHREQSDVAAATTTLLNLKAKILSGELSWKEAAQATSSCPNNSDLGFFPRGVMFESFEEVAFAAAEDSLSDVVETPLGWHLIYVVAHVPEEVALFEEVRDRIMADLQTERDREAIERYVDERKQCYQ
ncbi:MAG: peptidylprolyl isomerase [Kiritimatiellae bacterium]|nr:peptidylprolyl isomerase [Kiritimatiellia bacterium]